MIIVAESMSKKSRRNSIRSHSPRTHREFYSDERDLREDLERRAQQDVLGNSTEYNMEIHNLEPRNSEYALFESQRELQSQRRQLLEANQWADQAQRQRMHLCSELEMKNRLHQECHATSCQEIEEFRRRCYKEENGVTRHKLNEYSGICKTDRNLLKIRKSSKILTHRAVWQCPRFTSSSCSLEFKKA